MSDWYKSAKDYHINKDGYLCAKLRNKSGKYKLSTIKYEPYTTYKNIDGKFIKQ